MDSQWFRQSDDVKLKGNERSLRPCDIQRIQGVLRQQFGEVPDMITKLCPTGASVRWQDLARNSRRLLLVNDSCNLIQNGRAIGSELVPTFLGLDAFRTVTDFLPCIIVAKGWQSDDDITNTTIQSVSQGPIAGPGFIENALVAIRREEADNACGIGRLLDARVASDSPGQEYLCKVPCKVVAFKRRCPERSYFGYGCATATSNEHTVGTHQRVPACL